MNSFTRKGLCSALVIGGILTIGTGMASAAETGAPGATASSHRATIGTMEHVGAQAFLNAATNTRTATNGANTNGATSNTNTNTNTNARRACLRRIGRSAFP